MPNKNIQLILNKTTANLGHEGEIINVSKGYARNYLLPYKVAEPLTKSRLQYAQKIEAQKVRLREENILQMTKLKNDLESINKFSLKRKISENNNIFGSVNEKDIIDLINSNTGISLQKEQVQLPEVKEIGVYNIELKLLDNLVALVELHILPETSS